LAILARRQEIQPLHKLYLNRSIQGQYRKANFPSGRRECNEIIDCMFGETDSGAAVRLSRLSLENAASEPDAAEASFTPGQASRFSDAVVAYWVIIEARTLIMNTSAETGEDQKAYDRYQDIMTCFWYGSWKRTLLQTLDVLEVHDFVYGFLIRKSFYRKGDARANWSRDWSDRVSEARHAGKTQAIDPYWALYLEFSSLSLNPVQAARIGAEEEELADITPTDRLSIGLLEQYLRNQEIPRPLSQHKPEGLSIASLLEFNLGHELLHLEREGNVEGINDHLVEAWAHFRRNWATTARGTIFQSFDSSDDFMGVLRRWNSELEPVSSAESPGLDPSLDSFSLSLSRKALEDWDWNR
jgi:hypothetical protein